MCLKLLHIILSIQIAFEQIATKMQVSSTEDSQGMYSTSTNTQIYRLQVCGCVVGTTQTNCVINLACQWTNEQCVNLTHVMSGQSSNMTNTSVVINSSNSVNVSSAKNSSKASTQTSKTIKTSITSQTQPKITSSQTSITTPVPVIITTSTQNSTSQNNASTTNSTSNSTTNSSSNSTMNNSTCNSTSTYDPITNTTTNSTCNFTQNSTSNLSNTTNTTTPQDLGQGTRQVQLAEEDENYEWETYYINQKMTQNYVINTNQAQPIIANTTMSTQINPLYIIPKNFDSTARCLEQYDQASCIEKRWPNQIFCIWQNNTCLDGSCSDLTTRECEDTYFCIEYGFCLSCIPYTNLGFILIPAGIFIVLL